MKLVGRLKLIFVISIVSILFIPHCLAEPYFSSKGNITPVKLFQIAPRNASSANVRNDSDPVVGSVGKISRVVPLRYVSKLRNNSFRNASYLGVSTGNYSSEARRKPSTLLESRPASLTKLVKSRTKNRNATRKKPANKVHEPTTPTTTSLTPIITAPTALTPVAIISTSTTSLPTSTPSPPLNPIFLSSDSWNYLNSVVSENELRQIINGLSEEVVKTVSQISKQDPIAGQSYLMKNIISMLKNLKKSRMLAFDTDDQSVVNKGVRFSAKQQKPVLNVVPLEQKVKLGKPTKTLMKNGVIEHWNISGLISNDLEQNDTSLLNSADFERPQHVHEYKSKQSSVFKASPVHPRSTTPSLMQVLSAPDVRSLVSTSSPFLPVPSNLKSGFLPVNPTAKNLAQAKGNLTINENGTMLISLEENENSQNSKSVLPASDIFPARKPRGPPKDDEYSLPPITSTPSSSPEEGNTGYQTILGSTTPGPKVIWYNHNQTPEDTFYPNSDGFLMPPEESSIEILTDLLPVKPSQEDPSLVAKTSFSPSSSEISYGYDSSKHQIKIDKKVRPVMHYNSKYDADHDDVGNRGGNWGSRKFIEKDINKKTNKNIPLQPAATSSDHDAIHDYHDENGGSNARNIYYERKRYGPAPYNGYEKEISHHEIIPRQQKTRMKPPYDTESYGAYEEVDHYHDSYPHTLPVVNINHEIGPHRYRPHLEENDVADDSNYKGEPMQSPKERYQNDGLTEDSEYYDKHKEPKYKLKEASPYLGNSYGNHHQGYHGQRGHNGEYGNGVGYNNDGYGNGGGYNNGGHGNGGGYNNDGYGNGGGYNNGGHGNGGGYNNGGHGNGGGYNNGGHGNGGGYHNGWHGNGGVTGWYGGQKPSSDFFSKAKDYFKNSDFSTMEKWFDVSIGVLAFLAFGGYIIMLLYQVFAISSGTSTGTLFGRSMRGAGEIFDLFFSKGPMGEAYMNELETIVKRAMVNVKRTWMTNSFAEKEPNVKGETDAKK